MPRISAVLVCLALLPAGLVAQDPHILPDARLPRAGEVWIELAPALLVWGDRFGPDGGREPLAGDIQGPILSRLYPAHDEEILADLNASAEGLGYDPLGPADVSVGALDFGTLDSELWRALASVRVGVLDRVGILDRVAVELGAVIAFTDVEPLFAWDTTAATVARATAALPDGDGFLFELEGARTTLQGLVDGGMLAPEDEATALALLDDSGTFLETLRGRLEEDRFLPLAGTSAGNQLLERLGLLADGFTAFMIELPSLGLRGSPSVADLQGLFTGEPLNGPLPGSRTSSVDVGEVEAGLWLGLLDTSANLGNPVRLRSSVGAKLRIPIRNADAPPFQNRTDPFVLPIGDGQRDIELSAHQDLWFGSRWRVGAAGRLGIQAADRLRVRVHPPDRPFARPEAEAVVRRDLGDYLQLRIAPQFLLNDIISVGFEYGYWHKGPDAYRLLEETPGLTDAGPLELETRESRHRMGIGVFYRPGEGRRGSGQESSAADPPSSVAAEIEDALPWRLGIVFQWAVAGAGGRTPASQLLATTFRIPFRPF